MNAEHGSIPPQNPFQSPPDASRTAAATANIRQGGGYLRQVRIVASLLIVNGILILLLSAAIVVFGIAMQSVPEFNEEMKGMSTWMSPGLCTLGGVLSLIAVLQIVAGIQNLRFRGRGLGFAALGGGLLSLFAVYCFPSSLALAIYGLIVYLHPEVAQAFSMRAEGQEIEDIFIKLNA